MAKNRPEPQVLVPLRVPAASGFSCQPSKVQQLQQRASILTSSVKGGQAFISSTCQRKSDTQNAQSPSSQTLENLQPAPLQNGRHLLTADTGLMSDFVFYLLTGFGLLSLSTIHLCQSSSISFVFLCKTLFNLVFVSASYLNMYFLYHTTAYLNYIPLGTAVINMGNNLHLILPEGTLPLPVASSSSPVTSVLTPINQGHASTLTVKQAYFPPSITPVQRFRIAAPVLIPAPTRKPSLSSAFAATQSSSTVLTVPQPAIVAKVSP